MKNNWKRKKQQIFIWLTGISATSALVALCVPVGVNVIQSLNSQTEQENIQKPGQDGNNTQKPGQDSTQKPGEDNTEKPGQDGNDTNKPGENGDNTQKPGQDGNNTQKPGNGDGQNGGNDNGSEQEPTPKPDQSIKPVMKSELKEVGLVDQILEKDTNGNITNYWNEFFKDATNKQGLLVNADDFTPTQISSLNVSVAPVEQLQQWGGTTTYDTWKTTIDSIVYYSSSLDIFTIKDLNDLKTQLNQDAELEKILTSSGYTVSTDNTYSVESNSQIYLDSSKDHVQINILETAASNNEEDNKNINLKLPVSDLVVKNQYNISLTSNDKTIDLSTSNKGTIDLNYTVGISDQNTKIVESLKVPVEQMDEQYSEENILTGLKFLNPAPTSRAATNLNDRLNHQEISSASNIFNVTWSNPQLVGEANNPTAVTLQATPTEGHVWAVDESTQPKPIKFSIGALTRAIKDATMKIEYRGTFTKDVESQYMYDSTGIEQLWKAMNYDEQCKQMIVNDTTNNTNYNPDSIKAVSYNPIHVPGGQGSENGVNVVYEVYPLDGHAWDDGTTEAKLVSMTFDGFRQWKW